MELAFDPAVPFALGKALTRSGQAVDRGPPRAWKGRHALGKGPGSPRLTLRAWALFRAAEKVARRTQHHRAPSQTNSASIEVSAPSYWPPAARTPPDAERVCTRPATCAVRGRPVPMSLAAVGSRSRPTSRSAPACQAAIDPGPSPERVSAFPSSGEGPDRTPAAQTPCLPRGRPAVIGCYVLVAT